MGRRMGPELRADVMTITVDMLIIVQFSVFPSIYFHIERKCSHIPYLCITIYWFPHLDTMTRLQHASRERETRRQYCKSTLYAKTLRSRIYLIRNKLIIETNQPEILYGTFISTKNVFKVVQLNPHSDHTNQNNTEPNRINQPTNKAINELTNKSTNRPTNQ